MGGGVGLFTVGHWAFNENTAHRNNIMKVTNDFVDLKRVFAFIDLVN